MPGYLHAGSGIVPLCAVAAERNAAQEKISSTAAVIAASTVFFSRDKLAGQLVPARAAELSERFLGALPQPAHSLLHAMSAGRLRKLGAFLERATVPGIQLHYALRKRYIEETARRFIREGGEQVVVLGGGFDTLAIRLADEHPHVRFVEVDRPATQDIKTRALGSTARPLFLPLELSGEGFAEGLASRAGLRSSERTLCIAEGLLMYLAPDAVESVFAALRELMAPGSRFVFTFMERGPNGRVAFRNQGGLVDLWLRVRGEQFAWGITREQVPAFLRPLGFVPREILTSADVRALYLPDATHLPLAVGECVCVAERA